MKKSNIPEFDSLPESIQTYIEHLERMRRDFVGNVSHELRTPLTVMQGYLETLLQQEHDESKSYKKIFNQMYQHSLRMANIIEDLLFLSRLESDDYPEDEKHLVDVVGMLKAIIVDAKNISGARQHTITLRADSKLQLKGYEGELRSLFSNIIVNAVKYTPAKGKITIEWRRGDNNHAIFKVTDTGIGIAPEHIPRLTERFYRVDKARSRESGGTGLGLAIVKHVLLRHQGELMIESKLNEGSEFTCEFPFSPHS